MISFTIFSMRILLFIAIIVSFSFDGHSQSIIGIWQIGTKQQGGEESPARYVFKIDKSFEYKVNSGDFLQRIRAIGGTYSYKPGSGYVELVVKYTTEIVGGTIERSHITINNDSWSIEGGAVQKHRIAKPLSYAVNLNFISPSVVVLDENSKYYKIQ